MKYDVFRGSMVALVTPMLQNGAIDYQGLQRLIDIHLSEGTDALVILGSTGEASTINLDEKKLITEKVVNQVNGKIPVIVGSNDNGTEKTIELTNIFSKIGVDACLLSCPSYIKPNQEGLKEHFKKISQHLDIPVILYNVPSRTCCDLLPSTIVELSKISNIIGIKEASGDVNRVDDILSFCSKEFALFSGDDHLTLEMMKKGAKGVISVTANIVPRLVKQLVDYALKGQFDLAEKINLKLARLNEQLFVESNPIPVKWALNNLNLIDKGIRLPLLPLASVYEGKLSEALELDGVIS